MRLPLVNSVRLRHRRSGTSGKGATTNANASNARLRFDILPRAKWCGDSNCCFRRQFVEQSRRMVNWKKPVKKDDSNFCDYNFIFKRDQWLRQTQSFRISSSSSSPPSSSPPLFNSTNHNNNGSNSIINAKQTRNKSRRASKPGSGKPTTAVVHGVVDSALVGGPGGNGGGGGGGGDGGSSDNLQSLSLYEFAMAREMIANVASVSNLSLLPLSTGQIELGDGSKAMTDSSSSSTTTSSDNDEDDSSGVGAGAGVKSCRRCQCENETLSHILGSCPFGANMRNQRHHRIRSLIADAFRKKPGFKVYEEVRCRSTDGSRRRVDILVIDAKSKQGLVLDPTVRFEASPFSQLLLRLQSNHVDMEKKRIYEPCIPHLLHKFQDYINTIKVVGLFFGAQGAIPDSFFRFTAQHRLQSPERLFAQIAFSIVRDSAKMLNAHLFDPSSPVIRRSSGAQEAMSQTMTTMTTSTKTTMVKTKSTMTMMAKTSKAKKTRRPKSDGEDDDNYY